jgi:hypothetical protein
MRRCTIRTTISKPQQRSVCEGIHRHSKAFVSTPNIRMDADKFRKAAHSAIEESEINEPEILRDLANIRNSHFLQQ